MLEAVTKSVAPVSRIVKFDIYQNVLSVKFVQAFIGSHFGGLSSCIQLVSLGQMVVMSRWSNFHSELLMAGEVNRARGHNRISCILETVI